jgi:RND family efflux transporter MFP subunit
LAKLAQDKAQAGKTELDVKRYTPLAKEQAISQEELDDAIQANLGADAQVKADEAAVENAQLNLGFTKIKSPIDGLAGIALAQIGDLVGQSGGSVLTTVSTINPIKVYFQVSEQSYLTFWRRLVGSGNADENFPLQLIFSDGSVYPEQGKFFFADRQVNPNTGTLQIVGLFSNANYMLRPGQYGRVRAQTQTITNALLVPQRAVTELQGTYQVAIVGETNTVHLQSVTVGEQIGSNWIIENGLKSGDRVVVEGTQKVKEGAMVNPKPFGTETNQTTQRRYKFRDANEHFKIISRRVFAMYKFFINRPIVAMVIAILMVIIGLVSMVSLPVAQFPNIVPPEIRIQTTFLGGDAQTLAQSVATPIEEQMSGVDNMNYMYSISANNGVMRMGVNFDVKTDPNIDQVLAQLRENQAASQLPASVNNMASPF